jgi:parallel beta-helix repeat protein
VVLTVCTCFAQFTTRPAVPSNFHVVGSNSVPAQVTNVVALSRLPVPSATSYASWTPGVPGGIPSYPNSVNVRNFGARADGTNDDSAAFTSAILACTNGGAVYAPAGTYRLNSTVNFSSPKSIVVRGDGPTKTLILSYGASGVFSFGNNTTRTLQNVTGGYNRGSTNLTVASAGGLVVGQMCRFLQHDDPTEVFGSLSGTYDHQAQMFRVTGINGTSITIDSPIYYDGYKAAFSPYLEQFHNACIRSGIEDLGILYQGSYDHNVYLYTADQCWVRNIASTNANHSNVDLVDCYQCTVRDSQTYYHQVYDSNARYGVQVEQHSTSCLVENNILQGNNAGVILQGGASGNVVAYNYSDLGFGLGYPTNDDAQGGYSCHGDLADFNLFEGNVAPYYTTDDFWGCNRTSTLLRNWWRRVSCYNTNSTVSRVGPAIWIDATNYYHNVVGNVLGLPAHAGVYDVFRIGYARRSGNDYPAVPADTNVIATAFLHGNYSFAEGSTQWTDPVPQIIPNSYYLVSKPSWFGSLAWPPIGPDVNVSNNITNAPVIPAQARYLGVSY